MHINIIQRELIQKQSFQRSIDTIQLRHSIVVHIQDAGFDAYGEACPLPQFAGENYADCLGQLDTAQKAIKTDTLTIDAAIENIKATYACARFALSCARDDLAAQKAGQTLAAFLNPQASKQIHIQSLVDAQNTASAEIRSLKCKVGHLPIDEDITRLEKIRAQLPATTPLRLDANGAWGLQEARSFCARTQHLSIDYIEDPCATFADNLTLAEEAIQKIALDHGFTDAHTREQALRSNAFAAYILKPMCIGDIQDSFRIATQFSVKNKRIIISDFLNGSIARCAGRHLAAAIDIDAKEYHGLSGDDSFINDFHRCNPNKRNSFSLGDRFGLGLGPLQNQSATDAP